MRSLTVISPPSGRRAASRVLETHVVTHFWPSRSCRAPDAPMERPAHVVESCAVTLPRADAAAAAAVTQLCDSAASLAAVAEALFAGVSLRAGSQRGTCGWRVTSASLSMTGVPTAARPAGGALGTAACHARASGRRCSAEPEGAPCSALGSRMQLTRVVCDTGDARALAAALPGTCERSGTRGALQPRGAPALSEPRNVPCVLTGRRAAAARRRKRCRRARHKAGAASVAAACRRLESP